MSPSCTGERRQIAASYRVHVASDNQGQPRRAPGLILTSDEVRACWREAEERHARRGR